MKWISGFKQSKGLDYLRVSSQFQFKQRKPEFLKYINRNFDGIMDDLSFLLIMASWMTDSYYDLPHV